MADKQLQARAQPYQTLIGQTEQKYGIPPGLMGGLMAQESAFDPDVISGKRKSTAGAIGIAQFMPKTAKQFGIDPTDPNQAIPASGAYLSQLQKKYGNWPDAMRAYNWGPGNLDAYLKYGKGAKGQAIPQETREYPGKVLARSAALTGRALTDVSLADNDGTAVVASPTGKGPKAAFFKVGDTPAQVLIGETAEEAGRITKIQNSDMADTQKDSFYALLAQLSPVVDNVRAKPLVDTNEDYLDDLIATVFDAA
jgi:hypothetical protein